MTPEEKTITKEASSRRSGARRGGRAPRPRLGRQALAFWVDWAPILLLGSSIAVASAWRIGAAFEASAPAPTVVQAPVLIRPAAPTVTAQGDSLRKAGERPGNNRRQAARRPRAIEPEG